MTRARPVAWALLFAIAACDDGGGMSDGGMSQPGRTREQMLDPEQCKDCHPNHYREWASSMHAYAAEDPVFRAMNRRGQDETAGELGDFCVNCHAPMAVREGATTDGMNLDEVPKHLQGVTCYFCHNAVGVEGDHNNGVQLADDTTMRGSIRDPVQPSAHRAEYSEFFDRHSPKSSALCGGCHDIVTPAGVHLERTFAEYKAGLFSRPGPGFSTCQSCHMRKYSGVAADDPDTDVPSRDLHEHLWPGVDVALTDFPDQEAQHAAIECALAGSVLLFDIAMGDDPFEFVVTLETEAGHNQPSGAAQDRRMWVELTAFDADGQVIFESGNIADDEVETEAEAEPDGNRRVRMFRDRLVNADGEEVHMFWEAADFVGNTLPVRQSIATMDHAIQLPFRLPAMPARLTVRTRIRPMGLDVLNDLVDSGHLDDAVLERVPTFTIHSGSGEWTPEDGFRLSPRPIECPEDYACLLEHRAADCAD